MLNHLFTDEFTIFQSELHSIANQDKEKELDILFALNDLLPEDIPPTSDFVQSSLSYLKQNYGLTKAGWQVLLKLKDKIPDFTDKLSSIDSVRYLNTSVAKQQHIRNRISLNHISPVGTLPFIQSLRHYHMQKTFSLISRLTSHFGVDGACRYIGLFVSEFDTRESVFSINNLYQHYRQGHENLTTSLINTFSSRMEGSYRMPIVLRRLSWEYACVCHKDLVYQNYDVKKHIINFLDFLKIEHPEPIHFFFDLVHTYQKYTIYPFLCFDGMKEIEGKMVEPDDEKYIHFLLNHFHDYHQSSQIIDIELVRLLSQYENNFGKGLDKLAILTDYLNRSEDFKAKLKDKNEQDFSLNRLLQWSNQWHVKGESRGELKAFNNHQIDLNIDNYRFEQIKNNHELHEEGQKQSHCVYSYEKDCLEGKTIIVSMKDSTGKRISTLRFQKSTIKAFFKKTSWTFAENRKRFNRNCTAEERAIAEQYFQQIKQNLL